MPTEERIDAGGQSLKPKRKRKLLRVLIAGGLLLILGAAGSYYFWFCCPIGDGPAGPEVTREAFQHSWTTKPVLLVGLGDSVTAGFGARKNYSYFDRLITNPADDFAEIKGRCLREVLPNLRVTNLSISGSTSFEHLEKELPRLQHQDSNTMGIIVMTTGGNDLIHNYGRTPPSEKAMYGVTMVEAKPWVEEFNNRLEMMLERIGVAFPGGYHVFVADIFDPTDGVGDIQRAGLPAWKDGMEILRAYNNVIYQAAEKHKQVHVIRMHDAFLGHGIHCTQFWGGHYDVKDPHYWYYANLEDPNERGYDVIRRLFLIEIAKTLAKDR